MYATGYSRFVYLLFQTRVHFVYDATNKRYGYTPVCACSAWQHSYRTIYLHIVYARRHSTPRYRLLFICRELTKNYASDREIALKLRSALFCGRCTALSTDADTQRLYSEMNPEKRTKNSSPSYVVYLIPNNCPKPVHQHHRTHAVPMQTKFVNTHSRIHSRNAYTRVSCT